MNCPHCGAEQAAGNKFCEDCGAKLLTAAATASSGPRCPACDAGSGEIDAQGFCSRCGCERIAAGRDHLEIAISNTFAAVSDRGGYKERNEDFVAMKAVPGGEVMVVCDGVSNSQCAAQAAELAANTACESLLAAVTGGAGDMRRALVSAMQHAGEAVQSIAFSRADPTDPPETTIVAAVRLQNVLTVGWLGDSRAYLAGEDVARQLTVDHSWVNEVVTAGEMAYEVALRQPQAHSITRTLGGPAADGPVDDPSLLSVELTEVPAADRWLVLCTDGFWCSVSEPSDLAKLIAKNAAGDAIALARKLVEHASAGPGKDNITVAVLKL